MAKNILPQIKPHNVPNFLCVVVTERLCAALVNAYVEHHCRKLFVHLLGFTWSIAKESWLYAIRFKLVLCGISKLGIDTNGTFKPQEP